MESARDEGIWSRVRERLQAGELDLPVFPQVAQEVMRTADDAGTGVARLGKLIERDPGLCATVLRAASSVIYGPSVRVLSVKQAVARLGLLEIRTIAVAAAVKSKLIRGGPYEADLRECWLRAVSCGLIGKEVARIRRSGIDTAFLCGLFRHVGRLVAFSVCEQQGQPPIEVARAIADEFEVEVSKRVAREWKLPPALAAVLGADAPDHRDAVDTCAFAERLFDAFQSDDDTVTTCDEARALGLYPQDVERLAKRVPEVLESVGSFT